MKRVALLAVAFVCMSAMFAGSAFAQNASLTGLVKDPSAAAVPKAQVSVVNLDTGVVRNTPTNDQGYYVLEALQPGRYKISVQAPGFQTIVRENVKLEVDQQARVDFTLKVGSSSETVMVEGGAPLLDTESATIGITVDRTFVENLPLNGRSFQALIYMAPGVTIAATSYGVQGQFSVNGQRSDANYFTIDGVTVNGGVGAGYAINGQGVGSLPNNAVSGGFNNLVSVDAMQEFKIETSGFAPEYGRMPGGQISIVTRGGTNHFHGDFYDYLRNDIFDANDWFADAANPPLPKAALRQNDFGVVAGGPIVKDKLFFFFSYEGLRLIQPITTLYGSLVPSLQARAAAVPAMQPLLNAWPNPTPDTLAAAGTGFAAGDPNTAPYNATYSNPSTLNAYSIRGDYTINSKNNVFVRYVYSPSSGAVRTDSTLDWVNTGTKQVTAAWTFVPRPSITNDLRFNFATTFAGNYYTIDSEGGAVPFTNSDIWQPQWNTKNAFEYLYFANVGTIDYGKNVRNTNLQYNIVDTLAWVRGKHTIKFGADYRELRPYVGPRTYDQFLLWYPATEDFVTGLISYGIVDNQLGEETLIRNTSFYVQDVWKVTPRLTLTYGLRWEIDPPPSSPNNTPILALTQWTLANSAAISTYPLGHSAYPTTWLNFAPRVGVAYQLSKDPRWGRVIRGGTGVFFDTGGDALGFNYGPYDTYLTLTNVQYPLTPSQSALPVLNENPPYQFVETVVPNFHQPYTYQFNLQIQQQLGANQTFSVAYVGALGRHLARENACYPCAASVSPDIYVEDNTGYSNYNSLQVVFQRRFSRGLEAMVNWTYAHSLDNSTNFEATDTFGASPKADYGNSDNDIRHTFNGAISYNLPSPSQNHIIKAMFGNWGIDGIYRFRTAPPEDVSANFLYVGQTFLAQRPNRVPGQPLYLYGSQYPGGRIWNINAFTTPTGTGQGDFSRNQMRGFPMQQGDLSFRRDFPLHITESTKLQFRGDMFNIFNHPNFGLPGNNTQVPSQFGYAQTMLNNGLGQGGVYGGYNPLYNVGGPRSMQFSLKVFF
jgi:hypothetical protein